MEEIGNSYGGGGLRSKVFFILKEYMGSNWKYLGWGEGDTNQDFLSGGGMDIF